MSYLESCIFCKIIRGSIPSHKILETGKLLAFLDINPIAEGHILFVPKYHGARLHDIPEEYLAELLPAARSIAAKLFASKNIAYNVLQNNGQLAHQEVDHVHFHLIPKRSSEEGLSIGWPSKSISQEKLAQTAASMRADLEESQ